MRNKIIASLLGLLVSAPAFAYYYEVECDTCGGLTPLPGTTWASAAVAYAQAKSFAVGILFNVCKTRANGSSIGEQWEVATTPVESDSDLTYIETFGDPDFPCNPTDYP